MHLSPLFPIFIHHRTDNSCQSSSKKIRTSKQVEKGKFWETSSNWKHFNLSANVPTIFTE